MTTDRDKPLAGLRDMTVIVVGNADHHRNVYQQLERFAAMLEEDEEKAADEIAEDAASITQPVPPIDATNKFALGSQLGAIRPVFAPVFVTKQEALCFAAWLLLMAEGLPDDEKQPYSLDDYTDAIRNS